MKRTRRAILLSSFFLLAGAVVSVGIAEGIGYSGAAHHGFMLHPLFVALGSDFIMVTKATGPGWSSIQWDFENQQTAAIIQYVDDNHLVYIDGPIDPPLVRCSPPDSIPRWARLWDVWNERQNKHYDPIIEHGHVMEVALGWPLPAFAIDSDQLPPCEARGGWLLPQSPTGGLRVLAWRPVPLGLIADTLFWSACLATPFASFRLIRSSLRRRRGACACCGYDLRGLTGGVVCPECGTGAAT